MRVRTAPMSCGEIRIAQKHLRLKFTMQEVVALFRDRYTVAEIKQSLAHMRRVKREQNTVYYAKRKANSLPPRERKKAYADVDVDKEELIKANDRFASALRAAVESGQERVEPGTVTTPMTKAPRALQADVTRFGDSVLA